MAKYSATTLIQIQHHCPSNGVFIRFLDPICGWNGWLFNQTGNEPDEHVNVEEATYFRTMHARIDTVLSKTAKTALTLRAGNLTKQQARAISFIHTSPRVQRIYPDGTVEDVKVIEGSFVVVNGAEGRQTIQLEVETAIRNTQTN
ncbi:hypothetical protein [Adhaeribacter aquaticus]|uniref:hypothetical protein n=1 Tax=Adhaeribacter aquaticus TaxID=299567 RepID=UPI00047915C8|nr:hypothetical protein [Adhaeribacter aquaticus]